MTNLKGKEVVVRGIQSGVFFGTLESMDGQTVELSNARNIWRWAGAANLNQIAIDGVNTASDYTRISMTVDRLVLTDICELIPLSEKAASILEEAPVWKS